MAGIISPALEMGASVENHVFQEVGNALDVIRFIQRTRVDAQADAEPALGFRIRADEVGQAVGEFPLDKLGGPAWECLPPFALRQPESCFLLRLRPANRTETGTQQPEWR